MKKLLLTILFTSSILSSQNKWVLDKAHSYLNFSVAHMVVSDVTGSFKNFDVEAESAKEDFSDLIINATIKSKSIDTGIEGRDNHLRSADFFNADVDSLITFKSEKIEKLNNGNFKILGSLTMRGVSKPVELNAVFKGKFKGYRGMVAAFKATTKINRKDWGITWNRVLDTGGFTVGEEVEISIGAELNQK